MKLPGDLWNFLFIHFVPISKIRYIAMTLLFLTFYSVLSFLIRMLEIVTMYYRNILGLRTFIKFHLEKTLQWHVPHNRMFLTIAHSSGFDPSELMHCLGL